MKWKNNMISMCETGKTGVCPYCGSNKTDHCFTIVQDDFGYGDIWCQECKRGFHVSRARISPAMKKSGKMPKGIKY